MRSNSLSFVRVLGLATFTTTRYISLFEHLVAIAERDEWMREKPRPSFEANSGSVVVHR